ncbi:MULTISPECIES: ROK family protein [unclassified Rhizobium]|jgi:predicted NBD/HSP70 family sugar kinase|uniref:ROK family protein n=1 Tax=unclassified Rhizobium TaxID=2613769 RepID=UPI00068CE64B|nr:MULTISPECIES: ROK family protein [unclassified Rhizobium]MBN8953727.1 ROK family protein [Rhizobium tropici]RKD56152.1 putative NBD/HSP70 family sugar kinase [Rhizobium sp. WW_1]
MFSKPTMSAAVSELERYDLLAPAGINRGSVGRTSVTYGLGQKAGFVIGVDCGTTHINAVARGLDGATLATAELPLIDKSADERFLLIEDVVARLFSEFEARSAPLRAIAIALPNIISASLERLSGRETLIPVLERLRAAYGAPALLENNVNCAALAEYHEGSAKQYSFTIYMQIGVKTGMGIVLDGRLFRGFKGGAGEIGHLPFPWSEHERPKWQQVETYMGSAALLERAAGRWSENEGAPPKSASELFARTHQSATARAIVEQHARDIGNLAAACVSVLDPQLIVLGGGVGQNPQLLPGVRSVVNELCWPVEVVNGQLSNQATVLGAVRLAIDFAMARLLGEEGKTAFLYPTALTADQLGN